MKYDLHSIHRHFLYKHPVQTGSGAGGTGEEVAPQDLPEVDRWTGNQGRKRSVEKNNGGWGRKEENAGEKEQAIFPRIQVEASICFSFPEKCIITRQVGKLRL